MMLMTIAMDRRTASSMALAMACGAEGGDNGAHGYDDGDGDAEESMPGGGDDDSDANHLCCTGCDYDVMVVMRVRL